VSAVSRVARVVVDVTGVDKPFDYVIPDPLADSAAVGARVRVPLHGREVPGWVVRVLEPDESDVGADKLLKIVKVTSIGPSAEVVSLAEWAAERWASRLRPFLVSASPAVRVPRLVASRRSRTHGAAQSRSASLLHDGGGLVTCAPGWSPVSLVESAASRGPALVVVPTVWRAGRLAAALRRSGLSTAVYPDDWVAGASGVDVVVGARSAVWATVPGLAAIVVVDEHDDALQEERAPTWHARDVAIERARRLGVPCILVSPVATITAREWAGDRVVHVDDGVRWPRVQVVDRNAEENWASSLVTSPLIELLRDHSKRVVCVLNVKGRARAVVCGACRTVARCEACAAAVNQPDETSLACPRCRAQRPVVCLSCGSQKMRAVRIGVSRLRDELEAAAGRFVQEVKPSTPSLDPRASVFVGTEAVLHRIDRADAVVFLDIDSELLAPRFRSSEQALDLIAHGARLVAAAAGSGSSAGATGGVLVLQTTVPNHEVVAGVASGDLSAHVAAETQRRRRLRLPPFGALAELSGAGTAAMVEHLVSSLLVEVAVADDRALVRAASWEALSEALAAAPRGKGRVRIAVDPARA
jgi:primosomal protein N' (replication factor Y)